MDEIDVANVSFRWDGLYGFYQVQVKSSQPLDGDTIGFLVPPFSKCKGVKVMILHDVTNVVDFIIYGTNIKRSDLKTATYLRCGEKIITAICSSR